MTSEERDRVTLLISEYSDIFSTNENDVANIQIHPMKIRLKDDILVQARYSAIPTYLYEELKHYMEDLLNKNWIINLD